MLLVGAGLFVRSLRHVAALDLGVDLDHTLIASMDLRRAGVPAQRRAALYREMVERVRALPGVERVALAEGNPYQSGSGAAPWTDERPRDELWHPGDAVAYLSAVGGGFFTATGATSLRGRDFTEADRAGAPPVAIIGEPLARRLWPDRDALGRCMRMSSSDGRCIEIIGVLPSVWKIRLLERDQMAVYIPLAQDTTRSPGTLFIRAAGDPTQVIGAMQSARPDLPAAAVQLMRDRAAPEIRPWQLGATMFSLFGALALVIAAVGLYSALAYGVARRTHEIGVRMALGARRAHVIRLVMRDGLRIVAAGLVVGAAGALLAGRWIAPLLYETSPRDPAIFLAVGVTLLAVAVVASLVPAWRATRVDPSTALRAE